MNDALCFFNEWESYRNPFPLPKSCNIMLSMNHRDFEVENKYDGGQRIFSKRS